MMHIVTVCITINTIRLEFTVWYKSDSLNPGSVENENGNHYSPHKRHSFAQQCEKTGCFTCNNSLSLFSNIVFNC